MFIPPALPPFEAPYYADATYETAAPLDIDKQLQSPEPGLVLYGYDTVYDAKNNIVIFKLANPVEVLTKIKNYNSEDILLLRKEDQIIAPNDCPRFDLKPENVSVGYIGLLRGHITLTTSDVSKKDAAPILDKQCAKIKTQAVRTILSREEK